MATITADAVSFREIKPLIGSTVAASKDILLSGSQAGRIHDMLVRLRNLATRPEFTYSHTWRVGDLVMWDNTGTLHRATAYPFDCGRLLHRTKLEGAEPIA